MTEDRDTPPPRDGLGDDEAWEWADDHWRVRPIPPFEQGNLGGSPARVEDP
jgi:hypothetical protein